MTKKVLSVYIIWKNQKFYMKLRNISYYINHLFGHAQQIKICEDMSITPSSCFIFGIDEKDSYKEYNRGAGTNRLCLSKHFQQ